MFWALIAPHTVEDRQAIEVLITRLIGLSIVKYNIYTVQTAKDGVIIRIRLILRNHVLYFITTIKLLNVKEVYGV